MGTDTSSPKKQPRRARNPKTYRNTHRIAIPTPQSSFQPPVLTPMLPCRLRLLRALRTRDLLQIEREFVTRVSSTTFYRQSLKLNAETIEKLKGRQQGVATLQEFVDDDHMIVQKAYGPTIYTKALSIVDSSLLIPGAQIFLNQDAHKDVVVGVQLDDADPAIQSMKVEKKPTDSYADCGGLEEQIQELREIVEIPLKNPQIFEEIGVVPPKACILYGPPGTGKSLLARAAAHETDCAFLRITGSEMIQSYAGEGPRLVRELFKAARDLQPSIVFIDEIDAVGAKRYESSSGGGREIQRTLLELLNQLDGFDQNDQIKCIMATNRIQSLDSALIRPGRVDRKIYVPLPNFVQRKKIFEIHTRNMCLEGVRSDEILNAKSDMSGADIKAICLEAGLHAFNSRGSYSVSFEDFLYAKDKVLYRKQEDKPDLYQ
ncbi:putative 26S proteasome ATPase subunit S4 [Spironucleus salmonicida]|uniref:26S proteasome ATPase subunit S4 n=1 Tax=Spironucleus salmonicida TaxID=348837 RepID=V6LRU3_9EUKA|nr:putative 26S proteasome ATPase subunit S4 [Spironucleus salmonicida]|eukprot:EST47377.1 26S proteasome subunit P45 family [Spironucleus salmonicida]